eukprot:CAMPEP_0170553322 /NCGR_PEP_ID=MMETSP0211-20121228/11123_1 /TAXON_ID=311385 /ORGANISM="Pseudokeronopsis sp., Strain OXSARD2" /LENGTH=193 /DNA_ID=CAMNT_0010861557 /DNA_START=530 /DNA_END=1111 /DNA_ORIENTATION=+
MRILLLTKISNVGLSGGPLEHGDLDELQLGQHQVMLLQAVLDIISGDLDAVDLEDVHVVGQVGVDDEELLSNEICMLDLRSHSDLLIVVVVVEDPAVVVGVVGVDQDGLLVGSLRFFLSIGLFIISVSGAIPFVFLVRFVVSRLADLQVLSVVDDVGHHEFLFSDSEEDLLVEGVVEVVDGLEAVALTQFLGP